MASHSPWIDDRLRENAVRFDLSDVIDDIPDAGATIELRHNPMQALGPCAHDAVAICALLVFQDRSRKRSRDGARRLPGV